jgi:hypothetical protein
MEMRVRARSLIILVWVVVVIGAAARAELTAFWGNNVITAPAIAADAQLANMQSWSLIVTHPSGHWASAGLRASLPSGLTYYHTPPARGGGNTHPTPAMISTYPDLEFDTYVSSARNQFGEHPPAILGAYPESPPASLGGADDPIPGRFTVAWGDPQATSGPGPGTYEVLRLTFPQGALPAVYPFSQTNQVKPDMGVLIPSIPEPGTAILLLVSGTIGLCRAQCSPRAAAAAQ